MNQNIITYLNENKEKYSKDALIAELKKAGYAEGDIAEGIAQVFGGTVPAIAPAKTSFWNFKDKKIYTKASEKWADFLFGVFVPMIAGTVFNIFIFLMGRMFFGVVMLVLWVAVLWYIFNRRRMIFYGMITSLVVFPIIIIALLFMLFSGGGGQYFY